LIIDILPQIVGNSRFELRLVLDQYKDILVNDRSLLVPIIGSLSDMPLHEDMKKEVFMMTEEALHIVDENDVPTVVRALLSTMTKRESALLSPLSFLHDSFLFPLSLPSLIHLLSNSPFLTSSFPP
jgi:hypothetical protein